MCNQPGFQTNHFKNTGFPLSQCQATKTEGKSDLSCFTGIGIHRGLEMPVGAGGLCHPGSCVLNDKSLGSSDKERHGWALLDPSLQVTETQTS